MVKPEDIITPSTLEKPIILDAKVDKRDPRFLIVLAKKGGYQPYVVWLSDSGGNFSSGHYFTRLDNAYLEYLIRGEDCG